MVTVSSALSASVGWRDVLTGELGAHQHTNAMLYLGKHGSGGVLNGMVHLGGDNGAIRGGAARFILPLSR
jgi:hypothetical protein